MTDGIRVGVDVGGTFTKAVAVDGISGRAPRAVAVVPTTHGGEAGVATGVADALRSLFASLGDEVALVRLVTFSTTQAMNALLEGDVAPVAVVGLGAQPDLRRARKRTRIGDVKLAPGRVLRTVHEFVDVTGGIAAETVDAALADAAAAGCKSVAVSGAFAVDAPEHEDFVLERALAHGLPACAGHDLTGVYGLETRTLSAAINASILPVVERTATHVARALSDSGLDVPLLVLRGDGGAMSSEAFLRRPSFTIGSGPAAGVAAALHQLGVGDGIVVECGGTSSNVSVVKRGRAMLRTLRVMGRPTAIRSIDSWVVGVAGGSMARVGRRKIDAVGPRSAHIAGLPYVCFADPAELAGAHLALVAPRPGDPETYAAVTGARTFALTATCAANALGLVPEEAHARGSRDAALAGFALLGERLRTDAAGAARAVLEAAVDAIARAVDDAASQHDLGPPVPLVSLGGAGDVLVPEVARLLGREVIRPDHAEVLSSIGAAMSLVRAEVARSSGSVTPDELAREAERACVAAGAAPSTVTVQTGVERDGVLRAVATGAVALEVGALGREPADAETRRRAAASALELDPGDVFVIASNEYYRLYADESRERVAVVDAVGAVPLVERARAVVIGPAATFARELEQAVDQASLDLGLATMLPRVLVVVGPHILDLSEARRASDIVDAVQRVVDEHDHADAVAVIAA